MKRKNREPTETEHLFEKEERRKEHNIPQQTQLVSQLVFNYYPK